MNLLLDTHALLWWLTDSPALSQNARIAIGDPANVIWVSAASGWECATKHRLGKLPQAERFVANAQDVLRRAGMQSLSVSLAHGVRAGAYSFTHADPFDRILAAQTEIEGFVLVTRDPAFAEFSIQVLW